MTRVGSLFYFAVVLISLLTSAQVSSAASEGAYSWSGCYFGLHAGGGSVHMNQTNTVDTTFWGDFLPGESAKNTGSGFIGGGQGGCNIQVNRFVFGIETTLAGTTMEAKTVSKYGAMDDNFKGSIDFLMSVAARAGYAVDRFLLYAKGGYAGAIVSVSAKDTVGFTGSGRATPWFSGWIVGGGVEYAMTRHLIAGLEYDYMDLGSRNVDYGGSTGSYAFKVKAKDLQQAVAKIDFKFDWF